MRKANGAKLTVPDEYRCAAGFLRQILETPGMRYHFCTEERIKESFFVQTLAFLDRVYYS